MAINNKSLSVIQGQVTSNTTSESDFRSGLDDVLIQVDSNQQALGGISADDLTKLSNITTTAAQINNATATTASTAELNKLDGVTATTAELNVVDGLTATTTELNIMDGVTATTAEINKLDGFTGTFEDLNKIAAVTATATELNVLDGFTGNTADLNRTVQLDAAGDGTNGQVLTSDGDGTYSWTTPSSFTWTLEDDDGTEVQISTQDVKMNDGGGININFTDISPGSEADPFDLTFTLDVSDPGLTTNTTIANDDLLVFSDESVTGDPTRNITFANFKSALNTTSANDATITIAGDVTANSTFTTNQATNETITLSLDADVVADNELLDGDASTGWGTSQTPVDADRMLVWDASADTWRSTQMSTVHDYILSANSVGPNELEDGTSTNWSAVSAGANIADDDTFLTWDTNQGVLNPEWKIVTAANLKDKIVPDDSITNAKLADNAVDVENIAAQSTLASESRIAVFKIEPESNGVPSLTDFTDISMIVQY